MHGPCNTTHPFGLSFQTFIRTRREFETSPGHQLKRKDSRKNNLHKF